MDKRIRRNELCIIGLPRCDFVFSSTRSCFIAYGFDESALEMTILKHLLADRHIEPVEAGGSLAPAQNAFCAKICSKVITSQFCVILLNNVSQKGMEVPSANVHMEYGMMLGFNKYVIPFQRNGQELPFDVAGLDTIKYTSRDFEEKAAKAIESAITATTQEVVAPLSPDQVLEAFLLSQQMLVVPVISPGDRDLYEIGRPLGFNMLMAFDGMQYVYFGNFTHLRTETVIWRIRTLQNILTSRFQSIPDRIKLGLVSQAQAAAVQPLLQRFLDTVQIWALVTSARQKDEIAAGLEQTKSSMPLRLFAMPEIDETLQNIV